MVYFQYIYKELKHGNIIHLSQFSSVTVNCRDSKNICFNKILFFNYWMLLNNVFLYIDANMEILFTSTEMFWQESEVKMMKPDRIAHSNPVFKGRVCSICSLQIVNEKTGSSSRLKATRSIVVCT